MHAGLSGIVFVGSMGAVGTLVGATATRVVGPGSVPWPTTVAEIVISELTLIAFGLFLIWQQRLRSRIQIERWGRFEEKRATVRWWMGSIIAGFIVWAISLVVQISLGR